MVRKHGDARISYLRHPHNTGAAAARNTGAAAARAPLLAFQDSDDEWMPTKLERQLARLTGAGERYAGVYCRYRRVADDGSSTLVPAAGADPVEGELHRALLRSSFIGTPTLVLRRACFEQVGGFDVELERFQDWELMIRVSEFWPLAFVDEALVIARYAGDNISGGHDAALERAERRIVERHLDRFRRAGGDVLAYRLWHLGHVLMMRGRHAEARQRFRQALAARASARAAGALALSAAPPIYRALYRTVRDSSGRGGQG